MTDENEIDPHIEEGRLLFAKECTFVLGAAELHQLPDADRPEICFAGRSNVGKSTLINALTRRKSLARTSNTPGRTQQLNYFDLGGVMYLVDLPGYGYAEAPVHIVEKWQQVLKGYLQGRTNLKRTYVLIDSRRGLNKVDLEIMSMLNKSAVSFQMVLTKTDKIKPAALPAVVQSLEQALAKHPAAYPEIIVTSSEKGIGIADLKRAVAKLLDEQG